jgi:hypothetical protein
MYRVNYTAKIFGFVGWEVFTSGDYKIMMDCIKVARSQMSKRINENIEIQIIKL